MQKQIKHGRLPYHPGSHSAIQYKSTGPKPSDNNTDFTSVAILEFADRHRNN